MFKGLYDAQDFCQNKKFNYFINIVKCYFKKRMNNKIMQMSSRESSRTQQHNCWSKTQEVNKKKGIVFMRFDHVLQPMPPKKKEDKSAKELSGDGIEGQITSGC